jgi:hypothetical protein
MPEYPLRPIQRSRAMTVSTTGVGPALFMFGPLSFNVLPLSIPQRVRMLIAWKRKEALK